jgi:SAM-dependent methyltransferase
MSDQHRDVIDRQFGPRAAAYVGSGPHRGGPDLRRLETMVQAFAPTAALDLCCGGGHVAYLLAQHAQTVVAADLSRDMLEAVIQETGKRNLSNIQTQLADVRNLPFDDATFDFLACRFAAHHWIDLGEGLRESRRVLRSGGRAVFIDAYSPGPDILDSHLQAIELLRDPSHVRNRTLGEWHTALGIAGFKAGETLTWRLRIPFQGWIKLMQTPETQVQAIRTLQRAASAEVQRHFDIQADGAFMLDVALIEGLG